MSLTWAGAERASVQSCYSPGLPDIMPLYPYIVHFDGGFLPCASKSLRTV